jgi:hypothetical protein
MVMLGNRGPWVAWLYGGSLKMMVLMLAKKDVDLIFDNLGCCHPWSPVRETMTINN